ncbi:MULTISPECIES: hypothetical protein [unclassified Bacteroides]|uniref:hypothetical protein n=1 Tax=unclassified Bacteroides TaxID=2646097 RepID=UPI0004E104D8|nr:MULTISPECIES: hypothetical protein [unclassified Bacteroides]
MGKDIKKMLKAVRFLFFLILHAQKLDVQHILESKTLVLHWFNDIYGKQNGARMGINNRVETLCMILADIVNNLP